MNKILKSANSKFVNNLFKSLGVVVPIVVVSCDKKSGGESKAGKEGNKNISNVEGKENFRNFGNDKINNFRHKKIENSPEIKVPKSEEKLKYVHKGKDVEVKKENVTKKEDKKDGTKNIINEVPGLAQKLDNVVRKFTTTYDLYEGLKNIAAELDNIKDEENRKILRSEVLKQLGAVSFEEKRLSIGERHVNYNGNNLADICKIVSVLRKIGYNFFVDFKNIVDSDPHKSSFDLIMDKVWELKDIKNVVDLNIFNWDFLTKKDSEDCLLDINNE